MRQPRLLNKEAGFFASRLRPVIAMIAAGAVPVPHNLFEFLALSLAAGSAAQAQTYTVPAAIPAQAAACGNSRDR